MTLSDVFEERLTGDFEVLEIAQLHADPSYQRDVPFDDLMPFCMVQCRSILVNERADGSFWVVDGWRRVRAARASGETHIMAMLTTGMTRPRESGSFYEGNTTQMGHTPVGRWKALLTSERPDAVAIDKYVRKYGGVVNDGTYTSTSSINAPDTLIKIYEDGGSGLLIPVLRVISLAWPTYKMGGPATHSMMLKGMALFLSTYFGEIDESRLISRLAKDGPEDVQARAKGVKYSRRLTSISAHSLAILDSYNKGAKPDIRLEERRVDWRSVSAYKRRSQHALHRNAA